MEHTNVRYLPAGPGGWWVASEGAAVAVLAPAVTQSAITALWRGIGDGGLGAVLESLTGAFGTSLTAIPPFALAVAEPGGVRVAVRGALAMLVEGETVEDVSGEGVATWTERFIPGATRVSIGGASVSVASGVGASDLLVPLRSGVAVADLVVVDLAAIERTVERTVAPVAIEPVVAEAAAPAPVAEAPAPPTRAATAPPAEPAEAPRVSDSPVAAAPEDPTEPELPAEPEEPAEVAPDVAGLETLVPVATTAVAAEAPVDEYDQLWGETVARPVSAAAVTVADEATDAAEAPEQESSAAPIESIPAAPAAALGDHDGETVSVAQVRALRAAERERYESTDNVPPRRPAHGRIVLSNGRSVELERPVIIGRRPKSTRTSGSDLPTLVAVDSPEQDISRSHVEIRSEGEHVLVTDLDTTNGTLLQRGGQDPVRLHPGEPTMVVNGDILDLGDGVTVTFEGLA